MIRHFELVREEFDVSGAVAKQHLFYIIIEPVAHDHYFHSAFSGEIQKVLEVGVKFPLLDELVQFLPRQGGQGAFPFQALPGAYQSLFPLSDNRAGGALFREGPEKQVADIVVGNRSIKIA
jgi:hypothetical protein